MTEDTPFRASRGPKKAISYIPTLGAACLGVALSLFTFVTIRNRQYNKVDLELAAWCVLAIGLMFTALLTGLLLSNISRTAQRRMAEAAIRDKKAALADKNREITKREQTEKALQESEQRFRDVLQRSKDALLLIEGNTYIDCNDAAVKILGYSNKKAFLATPPENLSPALQPDGRSSKEKADEMLVIAIRQGSHRFEWIHRKANGQNFPVEVSLTAIVAQGKNRLLCVWRDITKQKEAEKALHASEQLYRLLVQNVDAGITLMDSDYTIVSINAAQCRMFGKQPEEFRGKKCYREFEKRDAPCPHCPGTRAMTTGRPASVETTGIRDDGQTFAARVSACPVIGEDGKTTGFIELVEDVTEYRKAQEAVAKENAKISQIASELAEANRLLERENAERKRAEQATLEFKTAVEQSADGIALTDLNGYVRFVNEAWAKMHGSSVDEPIGQHLGIFHTKEQLETDVIPFLERVRKTGSGEGEVGHVRKDGTTFTASMVVTLLINADQKPFGFIGIIRDVTERKQAEEALRASERRLRLFAENVSDVIWNMDVSGHFTYFSPSAERMFGRKWDENVRVTFKDIVAPSSLTDAKKIIRNITVAARNGQRLKVNKEMELLRADRSTVWAEVSFGGLYDESGRLVGLSGVTRDIRQSKAD